MALRSKRQYCWRVMQKLLFLLLVDVAHYMWVVLVGNKFGTTEAIKCMQAKAKS